MTKVTIDRALIEQAIDVINSECGYGGSNSYEPRAIAEALRAALAEPARTSQDVCTVPLLSDDEVAQCIKDASKGSAINRDGSTSQRIVRSAEQLVRRKARL